METAEFVIESIRSERNVIKDGKVVGMEYCILWEGWPASDMTWEPAEYIEEIAPNAVKDWLDVMKYFESKVRKKMAAKWQKPEKEKGADGDT